jgi:Uncharacterized protein conserved in bacteria (DUF2188)
MNKMQQFLEFETRAAIRSPQQPSELFMEREKALLQQADRVARLREVRLAAADHEGAGSHGAASRFAIYEVVRHRGFWRVLHLGKHSPSCPSQQAAIEAAVKRARKAMELGQPVEVRLKRTDGQVWPIDVETSSVIAPSGAAKPAR